MISSSASRQSRLTSAGSGAAVASPSGGARQPAQRLANRRPDGPPAARAERADRAAAVRIPAERDLGSGSAGEVLAVADRAGVEDRAESQPRKQADLEHAQPFGAGPVSVEQPQKRGQPVEDRRSRPGGARTACRPARRRRRRAPCARRPIRARRSSRSRRSAPASPARRRHARESRPSRARTSTARPRSAAGSCARRGRARTASRCHARTT